MQHHSSMTRIGDFEVQRQLGAGAMGVVYLARQISLDRLVALKVIGPSLFSASAKERFQREAQAVARLDHANIARVYYFGQDEQLCYMAMEYVRGVSIRDVLTRLAALEDAPEAVASIYRLAADTSTRTTLEHLAGEDTNHHMQAPTQADTPHSHHRAGERDVTLAGQRMLAQANYLEGCCRIVRDAAVAIHHAHQHGVVHRDLKPENLMLDADGAIKVIDFGVAKLVEDVGLTHTGTLVGTPLYMSPEQVTAWGAVDHRSDIYSLGMILYELLTLTTPTHGPTRAEVFRRILIKPLPPLTHGNAAVAEPLERIVHCATARDAEDRYASAQDLADDIQRHLDGCDVKARRYRPKADLASLMGSRPASIIAVAALLFGFALLFALLALEKPWSLGAVLCTSVAAASFAAMFGLLQGISWGYWLSVALLVGELGLATWTIAYPVNRNMPQLQWVLITAIFMLLPAVAGLTLLRRRASGRWLREARELRADYGE